ncbi:MAG TPA: DNA/RNA non-specific endonuclease [Vicinamibacterales bacterium]|nr:DNA/RNA non-specific endonuclease [Vicinamibacterales bacterium]
MRKILSLLAVALSIGAGLVQFSTPAGAISADVVISQVYGGGGNSGATYQNDFIELFNRSNSAVTLANYTLQYSSNANTGAWTVIATVNATIPAGGYLLIKEAGGANGAALPAADVTGTNFNMSQTNAKVALVSSTTAVSGACPTGGSVVDVVGYGTSTAACFEGTGPAPTLSSSLSAQRAGAGCTETDNNTADFAALTPSARNSATAPNVCGGGDAAPSVTSTTPAANAANVPTTSAIVVNFSESVTATASAFSLECPGGSAQAFSQSASPAATFTLTPASPLPAATTCTVKVAASQISDTDTIDPPDTMASDFTFAFSTASPVDAAPFVTGAAPANGASNVPVNSSVVITFSESVTASATAFSIQCPTGVPEAFVQSGSPSTSFTLTPSAPLPNSTNCTVTIAANQISDTDTNDPPDGMTSDVAFSFTTAAPPPPGAGKVRINEIDADTPGSDTAEFIELYDGGSGNTPLDGLAVVLYDGLTSGAGNQSYAAFDLSGYSTDSNGYFVLGNPGVPNASITFDPGPFGLLQNGPDAVALYIGRASDFPIGTTLTTTNLLDAIVYGTDDFNASGLLPLLNAGQKIVNEDATGNSQTQSSQRCPNGMGGFRNTSSYYPGTPTPGAANTCPATRPPSDVVISQIYGGGGNGGAVFQNDFVELYNRGSAAVDLTGWSLQYSSATGSSWDLNRQPLGGSIGPGEYYLVALASGGANGVALPAANISSQINISAASGNVALVSSYAGLVGACPIYDPTLKDLVGYGSADCGEGSTTAPGLSNTTALFRKSGGSQDTDNNAADFSAPAPPNPRRTAAIVELGPAVLTTDPLTNGVNAPRDATILVTFTEAVTVDSNWFTLACATTGTHASATFAANRGGQDQYITPNDNFAAGEQCTVTIFKDRVHDVDLDDSAPNTDTLAADYSWSFTVSTGTAPPEPPSVHLTMGNPSSAGSDPSNYLMEKPEYALSYNRDLGRPNWVSWHLSDEWIGTLARVDTFRPDPQVPPDWYRVQSFDFSGSGFDRGHMTPNADRDKETSVPINQATFLMSNMVAQSPDNNQGPWAAFESFLRTLVTQGNEIYIVAGPAGVGGTGSNGGVTTAVAGGHVAVPASTWKVALVLPKNAIGEDDLSRVTCSTRTIAVVMPNIQGIIADDWTKYLTTVDAVEQLTGYDFFSNLPEPYQQCIEAGTNGNNPPLVKGNQTITFAQPADAVYGDAPFTVTASGGASGNAVTFTASGTCTSGGLNGATITIASAGSCTVTASQAGSDIYNAAPSVPRTIQIAPATPSIVVSGGTFTFDGLAHAGTCGATGVFGEPLPATAGYTPGSSAPTAPGAYTLTCAVAASTNYLGAMATAAITIVDGTAPVLWLPPTQTVTATSPAGATVTFTASATDDVDGTVPVACTPASGSVFAIGTTVVACSAHDAAGHAASGSFQVVVSPPANVGAMIGVGEVDVQAVRHRFVFVAGENASGGEAGGVEYIRETAHFGRPPTVDSFLSTQVTAVTFFDAPGTRPGFTPQPTIDQVTFSGAGLWNGRAGYTFTVQALDAGEPGRGRDQFAITIRDAAGVVVATVAGTISSGNIESILVP